MTQTITLREFESLSASDERVTKQEWQDIRDYVLANPMPGDKYALQVGYKTLKARNYIGFIQTRGGSCVEILPKIDFADSGDDDHHTNYAQSRRVFIKMLRRFRHGLPDSDFNYADIQTQKDFPLLEAFIAMFLRDTITLTRRGLAHAYHEVEENQHYFKGKLLLAQHLRHNLANRARFYVAYETFSANRPINRLLKATLHLLRRLSRDSKNRVQINQALSYFDSLPHSTHIDGDLRQAQVERTMSLYDRLLPWARLFLKRASPVVFRGEAAAWGLFFPMELVFEDYVTHLVRQAFSGYKVQPQHSKYHLLQNTPWGKKAFRLKPDIVVRTDQLRIMDAKWKILNDNAADKYGIAQSDLYQLYAYGKKYAAANRRPSLYLLYPKNHQFAKSLEFAYEDHLPLKLVAVDLAVSEAESIAKLKRDLTAGG